MTSIPPAQRIPPACKTPINISVQHLPVSCVGGAQGKPLRWRVEGQPCHSRFGQKHLLNALKCKCEIRYTDVHK